jgi:hypothetical protein
MMMATLVSAQNYTLSFSENPLNYKFIKKIDSVQQVRAIAGFVNYYKARGYAAVSIDSIKWGKGEVNAFVFVGKKYVVKSFTADYQITKANSLLSLSEKFSNSAIDTAVFSNYANAVLGFYEDNGYPFCSLITDSTVLNKNKLEVFLSIDKGALFLFDSMHIDGDANVKKTFLSAYTGLKVGKVYSESVYRKAFDKLNQLPFLSAERIPQMVFVNGGKAKPYLYLKKKKSDQVNGIVGLAPSTATNAQAQSFVFTGEFLLKLNNLFKTGKMVMVNWKSFQARSQELKTAFNYPYILGQPFGADLAVDFLKFDTLYSNFNRQIGIQYYTSGINGFKVFYKVNTTNLISVDTNKVRSKERFPDINSVQTAQYGLSANFNLLDYRFNPRKGWWIESTISAGTKQILTDNRIASVKFGTAGYNLYDSTVLKTNQYQIKLSVDKFFPIGLKGTIKAGVSIEQIVAPVIYFNEVMREGGINSLKGFNEQSIYATNFNMLDLEYRYLLGPNSYIKAFWNGAYYEDHTTGKDATYDTPWGFGVGGNIETRAGILSILYALGKEKQNNFDLRAGKIHFGISSYF